MILYLYPEEWTGCRAREVHTLSTCVALARAGSELTLVTAGGAANLRRHLLDLTGGEVLPYLHTVALTRSLGPIRSAAIFRTYFRHWVTRQKPFSLAYLIHLKGAGLLQEQNIPYAYEAHEVFSETPQKSPRRDHALITLEKEVLEKASWRIATSHVLAAALTARFSLPEDFIIAPNAGGPPLPEMLGSPHGPFVYFGSLAEWKGLDLVIQAAQTARMPLRLIGGTAEEWQRLTEKLSPDSALVSWSPRVPLREMANALRGAQAGIIPTQPENGSGRYSCPMKLFDYARAGLPVLTTALPSLASLVVGPWCTQVTLPTAQAWAAALRGFQYDPLQAEAAHAWAANHTWAKRAVLLQKALLP